VIIIIDSMEQQPFSFTNIRLDLSEMTARQRRAFDAGQWDGLVEVETKFRGLGASNGDYTMEGYEGRVHIERKSMDDCHGTVLGWGERRERFTRELANLASMESAAVIVECELSTLLANAPERGVKTAAENRKVLFRQILSWQQQYKVPWIFCDGRHMAEIACYRWFKCFVKYQEKDKD
jgi:DNA excision repair protein ERCC-4